MFVDDFDSLDRDVWLPHYLPHWSSREESAATWDVHDSVLELTADPRRGAGHDDGGADHDGVGAEAERLLLLEIVASSPRGEIGFVFV